MTADRTEVPFDILVCVLSIYLTTVFFKCAPISDVQRQEFFALRKLLCREGVSYSFPVLSIMAGITVLYTGLPLLIAKGES